MLLRVLVCVRLQAGACPGDNWVGSLGGSRVELLNGEVASYGAPNRVHLKDGRQLSASLVVHCGERRRQYDVFDDEVQVGGRR